MKRALIEIDGCIDTAFCGQYERFKKDNGLNDELTDFFDTIVTDAYDNKLEVWNAIINHDEIWVNTAFIGDSGRLLIQMLDSADRFAIRDKTVINMRKYDDICWHMPPDATVLIGRIKGNNIKFIYSDDENYKNYLPCGE